MNEYGILKILEKHHPLKRPDLYQLVVCECERKKKHVPSNSELRTILQQMLNSNRVYIVNAPDETNLDDFPLHYRPALLDLASRRVR